MVNQTVHDPVCHMDITIPESAGASEYEGKTYYFCSPGCKLDFDEGPVAALKAEDEYDHSLPMEHGVMAGMSAEPAPEKKPWWRFW